MGELIGFPAQPSECDVMSVTVSEWQGEFFVWLDRRPDPLAISADCYRELGRFGDLDAALASGRCLAGQFGVALIDRTDPFVGPTA